MSDTTQMSVALPASIVEDIVKAEIVRHLGKRDELIASVINRAMGAECKCDNHRYGQAKVSPFACELERGIQKACSDIIREWIGEHRAQFAAALAAELKKPEAIKKLAAQFASNLRTGEWLVSVDLKAPRER